MTGRLWALRLAARGRETGGDIQNAPTRAELTESGVLGKNTGSMRICMVVLNNFTHDARAHRKQGLLEMLSME